MNVFEELNERDICYAVGVSVDTLFGSLDKSIFKNQYFIIASTKDRNLLKGLGFKVFKKKYGATEIKDEKRLYLRNLNHYEKEIFKDTQDNFIKVQHNKDGRIYELKKKSFRRMQKEYLSNFKDVN